MPTLNWIGKEAVVRHYRDVPFRLLEPVADYGESSGNLVVQGDNLDALKSLLPRYAGKVKLIYIDPPYNTGNEDWSYNGNVNSPHIRKWLGQVVGKITFWVRNLVRTDNSFYLVKADGRFYPDFVCALPDEKILVVEYKGADKWDTPKVKADLAIGELWAEFSDGRCKFVMVKDKDWRRIDVY